MIGEITNKYIRKEIIWIGGSNIIIRKLVSAVMACVLIMLSFFLTAQKDLAIIIGIYLFPILLIYGVPVSILSDFVTNKLISFHRVIFALIIHLFLATLFVVTPALFSGSEIFNFYFIISLFSSFLFYCIDEFLRSKLTIYLRQKIFLSKRAKDLCEKIGDLRI
ncbi:hypothetical protein SAMN05518871_103412 [Psychrobacillus sp. OK028]|uniref:hypothetical protein n=1 Tax=Psychrobacillus sp. OK028 TaxID=1884359 RepID=UPI00088C1F50|nr:hypothetical protein [Psychrobacillus sp. OK028]SDN14169.1 hypothetical protein SAMN05518871_103412 [Psychrobacillus sp. OK028]